MEKPTIEEKIRNFEFRGSTFLWLTYRSHADVKLWIELLVNQSCSSFKRFETSSHRKFEKLLEFYVVCIDNERSSASFDLYCIKN